MSPPKPLKLKRQCPHEDVEAQWFIQELRLLYRECPVLQEVWHCPNEGKRTIEMGHKLKEMGLQPGYEDYGLDSPRVRPDGGIYHGWRGELKVLFGNTPTQTQREWIKRHRAQGYRANWFRGHQSILADLLWYIGLPEITPDTILYQPFDYPKEPATLA